MVLSPRFAQQGQSLTRFSLQKAVERYHRSLGSDSVSVREPPSHATPVPNTRRRPAPFGGQPLSSFQPWKDASLFSRPSAMVVALLTRVGLEAHRAWICTDNISADYRFPRLFYIFVLEPCGSGRARGSTSGSRDETCLSIFEKPLPQHAKPSTAIAVPTGRRRRGILPAKNRPLKSLRSGMAGWRRVPVTSVPDRPPWRRRSTRTPQNLISSFTRV